MIKSNLFIALLAFAGICSAQTVGTIGVTSLVGGSGYPSNTTVTFTGCATAPTGVPTVAAGVVASVAMTYVGNCGTTVPTVTFTGAGGSGASATAVNMTRSIIAVSSVVSFGAAPSTTYSLACWLTIPAARVSFYANRTANVMPGSSQSSVFAGGTQALSALETAAFQSGLIAEQINSFSLPVGTGVATIETAAVSTCTAAQAALAAWNPWTIYGTFYGGSAWTVVTVQ